MGEVIGCVKGGRDEEGVIEEGEVVFNLSNRL